MTPPFGGTRGEASGTVVPGGTLGILGGGQLGRMLAIAARRLGLDVWVWSPEAGSPAFAVADERLEAPFDDPDALGRFAGGVDVVTLEFENVPVATLEALAARVPVRPGAHVLARTQDRVAEKQFLEALGVPVAPFEVVDDADALGEALTRIGAPAVLKSARLGYDGKGQVRLPGGVATAEALALCRAGPSVLERLVPLAAELSVLVARGLDGRTVAFPPFENHHERHVLDVTVVPARLPEAALAQASDAALRIAEALDLVGLLAVEAFLTEAGELVVNELAPRPHNSGHVSIEACETDQFEQAVRAAAGMPLGSTRLRSPGAMANLLGDLWQGGEPAWCRALALTGVHLHVYGKALARPGRKMGHLVVLDDSVDAAERRVRAARAALGSERGP